MHEWLVSLSRFLCKLPASYLEHKLHEGGERVIHCVHVEVLGGGGRGEEIHSLGEGQLGRRSWSLLLLLVVAGVVAARGGRGGGAGAGAAHPVTSAPDSVRFRCPHAAHGV